MSSNGVSTAERFRTTLRRRADLPLKSWAGTQAKKIEGRVEYVMEFHCWWQATITDTTTGEVRDAWGLSQDEASRSAAGLRAWWAQEGASEAPTIHPSPSGGAPDPQNHPENQER